MRYGFKVFTLRRNVPDIAVGVITAAVISFLTTIFVLGSTTAFASTRHAGGLNDGEVISEEALREKILNQDKFVLLDARTARSYDEAHIQGAILPLTEKFYRQEALFAQGVVRKLPDREKVLASAMRRYPKESEIVTYCNDDCQTGAVLLFQIKKLGFTNVRMLEGGFQSWEKKGYPVKNKDAARTPRP